MRALIALFNFALKRQHWIPFNPADGLRLPQRNVQEDRHPYSNEDLATLFGKDFRSCCYMKPAHRTRGADRVWNAARYWAPLLAVYSGARLGELVRLRIENVIEEEGLPCIRIEPEEDGRLKTESSIRTIPIHSRLLALGFLDYAEERRKAGDLYLFPQAMGLRKPEGVLSDWWPRYTKGLGVRTPKKTFHSLRHSVSACLAEAGAEDYLIAQLLGHANESLSTGRYGKRVSVLRLKEVVQKLDYGCDLG
jgi:integrase